MARTRYLKPGFFQNDRLAELGPWHRLLFAGLWTIADRAGRLEDRPKRIKGELFPYDDVDVDALLSDLSAGADPFVVRYEVGGVRYLFLPKFLAHQKIHANEAPSVIPACHFGAKPQKQAEKLDFAPNEQVVTTKETSETHQGDYEHALNLNSNSNSNGKSNGDGNGETPPAWRVSSPRPATIVEPRSNHAKCYDAPLACKRGYCLPKFEGLRWEAQLAAGQPDDYSASAAVVTRINAIVEVTPDGTEVPDALKWWREQWAAHRPPPTRQRQTPKVITEPLWDAAIDSLLVKAGLNQFQSSWFRGATLVDDVLTLVAGERFAWVSQHLADLIRDAHGRPLTIREGEPAGRFEHVDQIAAMMGAGKPVAS